MRTAEQDYKEIAILFLAACAVIIALALAGCATPQYPGYSSPYGGCYSPVAHSWCKPQTLVSGAAATPQDRPTLQPGGGYK